MIYRIAFFVLVVLSKLFFPLTVKGVSHLPATGGVIMASNHPSILDAFIIAICQKRRLNFFAKDALFQKPFSAWIFRHLEAFPVKRGQADLGAVKESLKRLRAGNVLLIFPEGTHKRQKGNMTKIHSGIGLLAAKSGVPVVPIHIRGSAGILHKGTVVPRRQPVAVSFAAPITLQPGESYADFANRVMLVSASLA